MPLNKELEQNQYCSPSLIYNRNFLGGGGVPVVLLRPRSEFELQSQYYLYFRTYNPVERYKLPYPPPSNRLLFFHKNGFSIK